MRENTTIAAISTPPGQGGIAVIRISGENALPIAQKGFAPAKPGERLENRRVTYGRLGQADTLIDMVMAVYLKGPHTFTGEDTVEISVHGGPVVSRKALQLLLDCGAAPARPGEFTQRAFLNGKMDLVQAEAVGELIRADSDRAHRIALHQLTGQLSARLEEIKTGLRDALALFESSIDFVQEDVELFDPGTMIKKLERLEESTEQLVKSYEAGKIITRGLRVALIGPPNAGKSSLFNALCERERVIVSHHPGTTRDTVEETITVSGQKITLIDTAGIRKGKNSVEKIGVSLSEKAAATADLVILVFDGSRPLTEADRRTFERVAGKHYFRVMNKADLNGKTGKGESGQPIQISALHHTGIDSVKKQILQYFEEKNHSGEDGIITNERQRDALKKTARQIHRTLQLFKDNSGEELLAMEIRHALTAVGEITGEVTTEQVLNHVFGTFCIGK